VAKDNVGEPTQATEVIVPVLVLPVQRSFVGRIMEVSQAQKGETFSADTIIVTVKNLEEKSLPITIFVSREFLEKDDSLAKLKILFKGNIVDLTVEDHIAFTTGYYGKTKDASGKKIKDSFMTAHEKNTKNFFVNSFETDTVDYRGILRQTLDKDEVSDELAILEKRRALNELKVSTSIAESGSNAFSALR
jgi:hypothetical protein